MLKTPFFDPNKTYDENYNFGPFGSFSNNEIFEQKGEPEIDFLGQKVYVPFGIPAGPLLNSKFCKSAFEKGFDISVYKTVRSSDFPCHPFPNVLSVKIEGDLTLEKASGKLVASDDYDVSNISITNSFGVPSREVSIWQEDVQKAISYAGKGQVLVLGFMGTVRENQTEEEFISDWVKVCKLAKETGAKIYEANLSCPNIGNEGLVCYNLDMTEKVCIAIRKELGDLPLILKVGYYKNDDDIKRLLEIGSKYANAISSINTIAAEIVDKDGHQALPGGPNRLKSGVCGASIKWAGLDMVRRLKQYSKELNKNVKIIGVGGVINPADYFEYLNAGADAVMSATGAMWNPELAQEIKSDPRL